VGGQNNICIKRKRVYNTTTGASLKISRMKIVSNTNWISFRPIFYGLVIVFLLGPPLAFSHYLSTSCNIFYQKQIEKKGPCGHRALISQERPLESGIAFVSASGLEEGRFLLEVKNFVPISWTSLDLYNATPLRC